MPERDYPEAMQVAPNMGLIGKVAGKAYRRFLAANNAVIFEFDDLFNEMVIVFLKARRGFDAAHNVRFSTYYVKAAFHHVNRLADRFITPSVMLGTTSIDSIGSEDGDLYEVLPDNTFAPEALIAESEAFEVALKRFSPVTAKVLKNVIEPSDAIRQAWKTERVKPRVKFGIRFVGRQLQLTESEMGRVTREVTQLRRGVANDC